MKSAEIHVGGHYKAKISGVVVTVRVDAIREFNPSFGGVRKLRSKTLYDVTNLRTGRKVTFRSAAKFRGVAPTERVDVKAEGTDSVASLLKF